ncbi:MAG: hypothetical protein J6Y72_04310 [Bacteroidales bacterium]|nr:hypothetical protein [Bacteroidales bacterium]
MKHLFIALAVSFVLLCCTNKKSSSNVSDGSEAKEQNAQQLSTQDFDMEEAYNHGKEKNNSKLSYCKYVTIGADTVFFTKNNVGHERLDNYIMPYSFALSIEDDSYVDPLYSVAVVYEKRDIIAITAWRQGDCEWPEYLLVYNKTTGNLLSHTLIATNGCGDSDIDIQMSLKNDSLFVSEITDCFHPEIGYLHDEYKIYYVVKDDGTVDKVVLLSAPDKFKNQKAIFADKAAELRLFELIYLMPDKYVEKYGIEWPQYDRKRMLYDNVKEEWNLLIKSQPDMKSIAYSSYNLETQIGESKFNFHLYKANDGREFFVTSLIDSAQMNSHIESYQFIDSCFVVSTDFMPTSYLQTNTGKQYHSYLCDGDRLTIIAHGTNSNDTTTYAFDRVKGVMTEIE